MKSLKQKKIKKKLKFENLLKKILRKEKHMKMRWIK